MNNADSGWHKLNAVEYGERFIKLPFKIPIAIIFIIAEFILIGNITLAQKVKIKIPKKDIKALKFYKINTKVMTNFDPYNDGFRFANKFTNDFIPALNWKTKGLCGGMCYAALDYYNANMPIPIQTYRPADRTVLHKYIYNREVKSVEKNIDRWATIIPNVGGSRNNELFQYGLSSQLRKIKSFIDRGTPVIINLTGGGFGKHQMVVIGYDMGRYRLGLGKYESDVKIYVYDPNVPRRIEMLTPNPNDKFFHEPDTGVKWRTYFVDDRYVKKTPPYIPNPLNESGGKIREMVLSFRSGPDGLRGGHANVNLKIYLKNGTTQSYKNINKSAKWIGNYTENASVILSKPIAQNNIEKLDLKETSHPGFHSDKWDMYELKVNIIKNDTTVEIKDVGAKRFTPKNNHLEVNLANR